MRLLLTICLLLPASGASVQRPSLGAASDSDLTNARITEMTKLGLGDDIIVGRIKTSSCRFSLSDTDLAELKKAGVSDNVIVAMLEAGEPTIARVTVGSVPLELHTFVRAKLDHPFARGMGDPPEKAYMEGRRSPVLVRGNSPILIELFGHDTIDNYVLSRMSQKGDRRELEVAAVREDRGMNVGIPGNAMVPTTPKPLGGNRYMLSPGKVLPRGEYIIFVAGSIDIPHGVYGKGYDFRVE